MVDRRVRGDLRVVRDVAVGELAAYDVGVGGEGGVGGWGDFDVVGDARVVIAGGVLVCCLRYLWEGWYEHHDGDWAPVSDGLEPFHDSLLGDSTGEVAGCEAETPLCASFLGFLELLYGSLDILGSCPRDNGVVLESRLLKGLALGGQNLKTLLVGQVDCLAGATEDDEPADAAFGEVDGVLGLRLRVEGSCGCVVVWGCLADEESWDGDVDARWWWGGHCRGLVVVVI